jgi:hypothetical protein
VLVYPSFVIVFASLTFVIFSFFFWPFESESSLPVLHLVYPSFVIVFGNLTFVIVS